MVSPEQRSLPPTAIKNGQGKRRADSSDYSTDTSHALESGAWQGGYGGASRWASRR